MDIVLHLRLDQSLLVLAHDLLREELASVAAPLTAQDLVVLRELHLVVVDGLAEVLSHRVAILDVVKLLQAVDSDGKDLAGRLKNGATLAL